MIQLTNPLYSSLNYEIQQASLETIEQEHIIIEIFKHFDSQMLCRASQVCRQWQVLSQSFWKPYLDRMNKKFSYLIGNPSADNCKDIIKKVEKNTIRNQEKIFEIIAEKYQINRQEVETCTWLKNQDLPVIIGKEYIDANPYDPKLRHHPMQFSFQDAFECTIDGINKAIMWRNLGYASYSDNLQVIHTPVISAISNLESEIRINGLVNWYEIIWFTLQQEGIVEDYTITDGITNFYP